MAAIAKINKSNFYWLFRKSESIEMQKFLSMGKQFNRCDLKKCASLLTSNLLQEMYGEMNILEDASNSWSIAFN